MAGVTLTHSKRKSYQNSAHLLASLVVYMTAPSARSLALPSNEFYNSPHPNVRSQEPILIDFSSGWQTGSVHEWYTHQPTTRFLCLEYRKDLAGTFRHEFIVVRLDNGACCRFDRRARQDLRVHAVKDEGTVAEDTAHVLHSSQPEFTAIEDSSELILSLSFPEGRDILLVLAIFFSIKSNTKSRRYTLTRYNCYFVCWTITLIVARCATDWSTLSSQWDTVTQSAIRATALHYHFHFADLDSSRQDTFNPTCRTHLDRIACGFKCTPFSKALHSKTSGVGGVIETTIQNHLLQLKIRALGCEIIQAALKDAVIGLAGRHALYIRRRTRIRRRLYLSHGLFSTRVYEPESSEAVTSALKKAATKAALSYGLCLNSQTDKIWKRAWDIGWEEGWPEPQVGTLFGNSDRYFEYLDSPFLRSRHKIGWIKEFKLTLQVGEEYLPVLTEAATSRFSELLADLDSARLTIGGAALSLGFGLLADIRGDLDDVMAEIWRQTRETLDI
ncbi:hypothetical protein FRC12_002165 [Ceratobasidium sp. 428]|nr:hypothetical protein FRC12_002165 [Ceratobasidium sp. 428]